jgi:hypothetical protein
MRPEAGEQASPGTFPFWITADYSEVFEGADPLQLRAKRHFSLPTLLKRVLLSSIAERRSGI